MVWSLRTSSELSEQQFAQWSKLLEERTGVQLVEQQRPFLQAQVSMRMRELGCEDYNSYFRSVTDGLQGKLEWSVLVNRLVVKETSFFRHRPSFEHVRGYLQRRIDRGEQTGSFDVWSVGCSTGEEPYSLAMVINDCFELARLQPYYGITATDISGDALAIARAGRYQARRLEQMTPEEIQRYMTALAPEQPRGDYQVSDKLRDRVCFNQGNVLNLAKMPAVAMDVIYCQNLLVYFRRWLRRDILNNLVERLKPGGLLVVGLGEVVDWKHPQMLRQSDDRVQAYCRVD